MDPSALLKIINDARKNNPALAYAQGVVAIMATAVLITTISANGLAASTGAILTTIGLMGILFYFTVLVEFSKQNNNALSLQVVVFTWVVIAVVSASIVMLFTSFFWEMPRPIYQYFPKSRLIPAALLAKNFFSPPGDYWFYNLENGEWRLVYPDGEGYTLSEKQAQMVKVDNTYGVILEWPDVNPPMEFFIPECDSPSKLVKYKSPTDTNWQYCPFEPQGQQ